jgi:hypothetical protein
MPVFAQWMGPGLAVLGLAIVATVLLRPLALHAMLERGVLAVVSSYERALPLLGLALALARVRSWQAVLGALLAVIGVSLGFLARDWLIAAVVSGPATASRLALPGPIACLVAGLSLAVPDRLRPWVLAPAAIVIGAMLALAIKLVDPSFHDPNFVRGALAAGAWLVAALSLSGRLCAWPWCAIASRILGSWLVAIGLMLGAAILAPRSMLHDAPPPLPETLVRPLVPGENRRPTDDESPQTPFTPPGYDPRRQL